MRRLLAIALLVACAPSALGQSQEATIQVPEVEVRSGPSLTYYATGKLKYGQPVKLLMALDNPIKGKDGDYVKIAPPADAFSVVAKQSVRALPGNQGVIEDDSADTRVGSVLVADLGVVGARLLRGSVVQIHQSFTAPTVSGGQAEFFKIVPLNEVRYIPADAVKKQAVVRAGGAAPAQGGGVVRTGGTSPAAPADDQLGALLNRADVAYKRGDATKDWAEAKQLYEEIRKSNDHEARMIAWARLSFIERQEASRIAGNRAGGSRLPPGNASNNYSPGATSGPAGDGVLKSSGSRASTPGAVTALTRTGNAGKLRRAGNRAQGRPMYYLEDEGGRLLFYVAAANGLDLEPYVEQQVEIQGGPMVFRQDLNGNYRVAVSARHVQ